MYLLPEIANACWLGAGLFLPPSGPALSVAVRTHALPAGWRGAYRPGDTLVTLWRTDISRTALTEIARITRRVNNGDGLALAKQRAAA